ncbi:alcohol dehydrogenase catalytic domain-containing protein [Rhodococcoides fascians]|uniref:alcohol dehydrogenase catalytic domain-containing protein n=1 Tax=Rhodococcoides fascians TaxID=1828 RepID=UPI0037921A23
MPQTMRAARMHRSDEPLKIDNVPVPRPRSTDVLVEVKACGIVPNLGNVLRNLGQWYPHLTLPPLPAIYGLDPSGVIVDKGEQVHGLEIGQRVYVNPARYCGGCIVCRTGEPELCESFACSGYFGVGRNSQQLLKDYPYGGMCEYMTAPQYAIATIPDNVSHESAARWGYLGTAYKALRLAGAGPNSTVVVNGATGTLGLGVVLFALALGVGRIFAVARDQMLLDRVKALSPARIETLSTNGGTSIAEWVRSRTHGDGASIIVDSLGPGAPAEVMLDALGGLRRGGQLVNVGAVTGEVPVNLNSMMSNDRSIIGSNWFSTADAQAMAGLAEAGLVDLDVFEHEIFKLDEVNEALSTIGARNGGFSNYVIVP